MAHPLLIKAAEHVAQARAINDEFEGKVMPAEAAHQMQQHLEKASEYKARCNREAALMDMEGWVKEPQYKHDMNGGAPEGADPSGAGGSIADKFGHGTALLESEKQKAQNHAFFEYLRKG